MAAGESGELVSVTACPGGTEQAGSAPLCSGCPGAEQCRAGVARADPDQRDVDIRMGAVARRVLVLSGKGGVGKSAVAASLALALALRSAKAKIGLCDVDLCGPSQALLFGVSDAKVANSPYGWTPVVPAHAPNLKLMSIAFMLESRETPVLWRGPRKTSMLRMFLKDTFWGKLDWLVFDTPPGTSDEHLTVLSLLRNVKPHGAVIVTTPQDEALLTVRREIVFCQQMGVPLLGVVENMAGFVCPCCGEVTHVFAEGGGRRLAHEYDLDFLGSLPVDPRLAAAHDSGVPAHHPLVSDPLSPVACAINGFVDRLIERLG